MDASLNSLLALYSTVTSEVGHFFAGVSALPNPSHVWILFACLLLAYAFEFVNGFHDTANAVATVIFTKSLKPWPAVIWAGICNFAGVFVGGTVVAMAIVKLIPPDLIMSADLNTTMSFMISLLLGALIWNVGTWYFGIPASSSHTLIGSILGIGIGHSLMETGSIVNGVNWSKAADVGLALLVSPLIGFGLAAGLLLASKKLIKNKNVHREPKKKGTPPWSVRSLLIATSTGVSFAHGSNDGQKGVGLVMLILIAIMPAQYALKPQTNLAQLRETLAIVNHVPQLLDESYIATAKQKAPAQASLTINVGLLKEVVASETAKNPDLEAITKIKAMVRSMNARYVDSNLTELPDGERFNVRNQLFSLEKNLGDLEKKHSPLVTAPQWGEIKKIRKQLSGLTDYAPITVLILIALALGFGTTIGWKRVVVTVGEKIGKNHMTYAQGAAAELVAASTIAMSTAFGLPVSTTHILSSGIAGTMVANKSGVQSDTVKKILTAWVLTLPVTIVLSASIYCALVFFVL